MGEKSLFGRLSTNHKVSLAENSHHWSLHSPFLAAFMALLSEIVCCIFPHARVPLYRAPGQSSAVPLDDETIGE